MGKDRYMGSDNERPYSPGQLDDDYDTGMEVQHGASAVSATQSKNLILVLGLMGVVFFVAYTFLWPDSKEKVQQEKAEQDKKAGRGNSIDVALPGAVEADPDLVENADVPPPPAEDLVVNLPPEIVLPEPPKLVEPTPPPPPAPAAVELPALPEPQTGQNALPIILGQDESVGGGEVPADKKDPKYQRKVANSLLVSGGGEGEGGGGLFGGAGGEAAKESPNAGDLERMLNVKSTDEIQITSADQAYATRVGDLTLTVAQGKIIDAVLETGINTDLPGMLRAVVSRDIYSEAGGNLLIPKGSRLVGNYEAEIKRGQRRVYVIWARLIRPDGIDMAIDSPGTDQLGRAGVAGKVDNKYFEIFGNAFLLSAMTIGTAFVGEAISGSEGVTTTETSGGNSQTSGSLTAFAVQDAVTQIGDTGKDLFEDFLGTQPTITVNQGTRLKVFVNRDLIFPPVTLGKVKYVR
jgi:type IV secretion system protein VirB10